MYPLPWSHWSRSRRAPRRVWRHLVPLVLEGEITTRANKSQALATLPTFVKNPRCWRWSRWPTSRGQKLKRKSFVWDNQLGVCLSQDWRWSGWFARRAGQPAGEIRPITGQDVFNTFIFTWRLPCKIIKFNPRGKTRFKEGLLNKQMPTRPRHRFCVRPF